MRLRDLEAHFYRIEEYITTWVRVRPDGDREEITGPRQRYVPVENLSEAQGLWFLCPKCFEANGRSNVGVHAVICWFADRGVPDDTQPKPGRWRPAGTGIDDLTFVGPDAASVQLVGGCNWHGFVRDGDAA